MKSFIQPNTSKKGVAIMVALLAVLSLSMSAPFATPASAQTAPTPKRTQLNVDPVGDFVIGPGKTEVFLNPGESVTKYINVVNRAQVETTYIITMEDIVGSDDPKQAVKMLGNEKGPYSVKDLLTPYEREFTLKFGESIDMPITISVPADAAPGGYYGIVIVGTKPREGEIQGAGAKIISRVGAIFLVRVNGAANESGKLESFKVAGPKKLFYSKTPAAFEILFRNEGNVHLVPYGTIDINNMWGKDVASIPVDSYFALPESLRSREVSWAENTGFGKYTAELSLYRGYGNQNDTMSVSFWVLPWKILGIIFGVVLVLSLFLYLMLTRLEFKKK
jgi:hypothetical protein